MYTSGGLLGRGVGAGSKCQSDFADSNPNKNNSLKKLGFPAGVGPMGHFGVEFLPGR